MKKLYRLTSKSHNLPGRAVHYKKETDKDSEKKMIAFF